MTCGEVSVFPCHSALQGTFGRTGARERRRWGNPLEHARRTGLVLGRSHTSIPENQTQKYITLIMMDWDRISAAVTLYKERSTLRYFPETLLLQGTFTCSVCIVQILDTLIQSVRINWGNSDLEQLYTSIGIPWACLTADWVFRWNNTSYPAQLFIGPARSFPSEDLKHMRAGSHANRGATH